MQYYSFNIRLASSFACFSSDDLCFHLMLKKDELDFSPEHLEKGFVINSKLFPMLKLHEISHIEAGELVTFITFKKDEQLFNKKTRFLTVPEKLRYKLVEDAEWQIEKETYEHLGWTEYSNKLPLTKQLEKDQFKLEEEIEVQNAKKRGLLLAETLYYWTEKPKLTPKQYQGGFSDEVYNHFEYYVSGKSVHGYLGHIERTIETDKVLEENLKKLNISPKGMANWLTSTDGRHMMDWLANKETKEKIEFLKYSINRIHNLCLIYGSPYHQGNLKSTMEIREEYEKEGLILSEPEMEYDNWYQKVFSKVMNVL